MANWSIGCAAGQASPPGQPTSAGHMGSADGESRESVQEDRRTFRAAIERLHCSNSHRLFTLYPNTHVKQALTIAGPKLVSSVFNRCQFVRYSLKERDEYIVLKTF